jgi:hypothetical protein
MWRVLFMHVIDNVTMIELENGRPSLSNPLRWIIHSKARNRAACANYGLTCFPLVQESSC